MTRTSSPLIALILAAAGSASAQEGADSGAFIVRLGNDTVAVERFARTGGAINLEQVVRTPQTSLRHTHLGLSPAGELSEMFVMVHPIGRPMDAPLLASTKLTIAGDSGTVEARRADSASAPRRVAARNDMIPATQLSFLPFEIAATRARAAKTDSMTVTFVNAGGGTTPIIVRRVGVDSMTFTNPFLTYRARVDADGRILGLHAPGSTFQIVLARVAAVDINGLATAWHAKDRQGAAMGMLSPPDSVRATVGEATIAIDYNKPSARGRKIFGGEIVPWGTVWRTGANAATTFTTSRDLEIGGQTVPAGSYTLWTVPMQQGTTLIINKQTKDDRGERLFGTGYNQAHDLVRVPMTTTTLSAPAEQFTISVEPRGSSGGAIRMRWEMREMAVAFTVK